MTRRISDPKTREKFVEWMTENSLDPGNLDEIDVEAEFGTDLTYNEAVDLAVQKFPTFWKNESTTRTENKAETDHFRQGSSPEDFPGEDLRNLSKIPEGRHVLCNDK